MVFYNWIDSNTTEGERTAERLLKLREALDREFPQRDIASAWKNKDPSAVPRGPDEREIRVGEEHDSPGRLQHIRHQRPNDKRDTRGGFFDLRRIAGASWTCIGSVDCFRLRTV